MADSKCEIKVEINGQRPHLVFPTKYQFVPAIRHITREDAHQSLRGLSRIKPINYIVDVGANVGATALMFHQVFPDARILALEPTLANYKYLLYNTSCFPQITAQKIGAYNRHCDLNFAYPSSRQKPSLNYKVANSGIFSIYGEDNSVSEIAEVDRLDNIVDGTVDLLKMDVEGAESFALEGAKRIITEDRPIIITEMRLENIKMASLTEEYYINYYTSMGYITAGKYFGDVILSPKELNIPQVIEI